jgi:hypothetical protein
MNLLATVQMSVSVNGVLNLATRAECVIMQAYAHALDMIADPCPGKAQTRERASPSPAAGSS